jgi:FlaA1/EpsC-like NDP-sugar epimerase
MGATKRVGEAIVRARTGKSATRFCAVRFGNVLGSAGSVVPLFREQIATGGPVTVTDPEVRRYFMTISEAVALVLRSAYGDYGELCVLDMGEQIRIAELARYMITMSGQIPDVDIAVEFIGLRPGEKLSEELMTEEEERTRRVNHRIFVADSPLPPADLSRTIIGLARAADDENVSEILELLRRLVPSYTPSELLAPPVPSTPEEPPPVRRASSPTRKRVAEGVAEAGPQLPLFPR